MIRVGITGGIGSGKSTVCRIFEFLGIPVYDADSRAKLLAEEDPGVRSQLQETFGSEAYLDGRYNKPYIASRVFGNPEELARLNAIIHPAVLKDWETFCKQHADRPYIIKEAAVMLEAGAHKTVDKVVLVCADLETRISRVSIRDSVSREQILARMAAQMPEEEKRKLADYVLENDGNNSLIKQVLVLHHKLMQEAGEN